jgi:hypothetical protein
MQQLTNAEEQLEHLFGILRKPLWRDLLNISEPKRQLPWPLY